MKKRMYLAVGLLPLSMIAAAQGPSLVVSTWDLGASGGWNGATNWNPDGVPNNDATNVYDVILGDEAADIVVTLATSLDIETLTVTPGDELLHANGADLIIRGGSILNDGLINPLSTGSLTDITIDGNTDLSGTGTIRLSHLNSRMGATTATDRLTNGAAHTIEGGGQVGVNTLSLTNNGLIDANNSSVELTLDPPTAGDFTNNNVLRATAGGTLGVKNGTFANAAGTIEAHDASFVEFGGATIMGGELISFGSGQIWCDTNALRFEDIVNNADFRVANAIDPVFAGSFVNNTTFTIDGTGSTTQVRIDGDLSLTGGGVVTLANTTPNNRLEAVTAGDRLTNVDNLIHGGGSIGLNNMSLTNQHLVVADNPATSLVFDPPTAGDFTNENIFRAENGATLTLNAGTYDNIAGTIEALDASQVLVNTSTIIGGELKTVGTGVIWANANTARFENITNNADLRVKNAIDPVFAGSLVNNVSVTLDSVTSTTQMKIDGDISFTGGGEIHLANGNPNNRLEAVTAGNRLTNVDNLIHGGGQIGLNNMSLTNQHLIVADDPTQPLSLDPPTAGDFTNEHIIRADGATLVFQAGTYINTSGVIEVLDGSDLVINTSTVIGGSINSSGSGEVRLNANTVRLVDVTNNANMRINNGQDPVLEGSFINNATLTFDGVGATTQLKIDGDLTISGGGTIDLAAAIGNRIEAVTAGDRLTNLDNTIQGGGSIGLNAMSFTNQGTVNATHDTIVISFDPPTAGDFTNQGMILASGDVGITMQAGPFDNQAIVTIDANSKLNRLSGDYTQSAGTTTVNGELQVGGVGGVIDIQGGSLKGTGLVDGVLAPNGGSVDPGNSAGTLNVEGSFEPTFFGNLNIELAGTLPGESDVLAIDGDAVLAGTLNTFFIEGYSPSVGDTFTILTTTGTVSGEFDNVNCSAFTITYNIDSVVIEFVAAINVADINCDGVVNTTDLLILLAEWGPCPKSGPCAADIEPNGSVDVGDLLLLLANWS